MTPKGKLDLLIAGVGGQGVILASDILAEVGLLAGYEVKKSDVLGMSQRGGSVVSHVRLGEEVHSPLIPRGEVDYLIGFEELEAARAAEHLAPEALAIVNRARIPPPAVALGQMAYPSADHIQEILSQRTAQIHILEATVLAQEIGNNRAFNVLLLGYLSHFLPLEERLWEEALSRMVPGRHLEINRRAFARGRQEAEGAERRKR